MAPKLFSVKVKEYRMVYKDPATGYISDLISYHFFTGSLSSSYSGTLLLSAQNTYT